MSAAEMEKRLLELSEAWASTRVDQRRAEQIREEYRSLHARWMAARGLA
jgi:hypothetical protein